MKKALAFLVAAMMLVACVGCNNTTTEPTPAPTVDEPTTTPETTPEAQNPETPAATGSVYYLNFKPEADAGWQALAESYTAQFGVPVKVVTAASNTYADTLNAQMGKEGAPTLFQCGNAQGLADWNDYMLDLTDTAVYNEMTTHEYDLNDETGAVKAIAYCYESYGIIVNTALLKQAGYELTDITDFASLKAVADDIHARSAELGFDAFSSAGLDPSSSWRFSGHLVSVPLFYEFRDDGVTEQPASINGTYIDNFRQIWDLYITDSAANPTSLSTSTSDESEAEFGQGKAVFYQNGSWEFANLVLREDLGFMMNADDLAMIPIYCGVEGEEKAGLCNGTENRWAVNSQASEEDIQATLDFLYWVVTSDEGTQMLADNIGAVPFKSAKVPANSFCASAQEYAFAGNYDVAWAFNYTPNMESWRAGVVTALTAYTADPSDANWEAVKTAVVEGWAIEYAAQNG